MGIFTEYIDRRLDMSALTAERKVQLTRIAKLRGNRDILVYAADLKKGTAPISMTYEDLLPVNDQVSNLHGKKLDLILETPGGSGEVAEDIVRLLHEKYDEVGVIVPGWAKSAGTLVAMAGDEILMEPASALGPIDAQISWQGKIFSADALLEGLEKIKHEVVDTGVLNKAYIPILQGISPGELQSAQNALDFAKTLVTDWLVRFKFKNWEQHSKTKAPVTPEERRQRAKEIADKLCDHKRWLTHGRSIKIEHLEEMRLRITDYSQNDELADAVRRYHTLLQMTFASSIYKVFETPTSQIYRFIGPVVPAPQGLPTDADFVVLEVQCSQCKTKFPVQANLGKEHPLQGGCIPFPVDNKFNCPTCGAMIDLTDARRQVEVQSKKPVVPNGGSPK